MTVEIITPIKKLCVVDNVTKLRAPGVDGDFGVWKDHASFVTMLGDGDLVYTQETEEGEKSCTVKIKKGFFGVMKNRVIILADEGEIVE